MDEKSLIFGISNWIEDLIISLIRQKINLDLENDYYLNISPPPIPEATKDFGDGIISGIFVELNEELVNAIINWLQEKKTLTPSKLKITINGNLLNINDHDVKIMKKILDECRKKTN